MKQKIYRAGLIPYVVSSTEKPRMMFMKPSDVRYGGDKFQIAKGKIEIEDLSPEEAAIREAEEELGLVPENIEQIWKLGIYLGRTTIYVAKLYDNENFIPFGDESSDVAWMNEDEFLKDGRPLHHSIISDAMSYVINYN